MSLCNVKNDLLTRVYRLAIFDDWVIPQDVKPQESIGCVVDGTKVSVGIIMILGAVALLFLALMFAQCFHLVKDRQSRSRKEEASNLLPFNLADWQLAAYRQRKSGEAPTFKELRNISIGGDLRFLEPAQEVRDVESRPSTLHDKFEWEDRDGVDFQTEHTNQKPLAHALASPVVKSDRQSRITRSYISIGDTQDFQRTDEQGLLEQYGDRSMRYSDNVVR